MLRQSRINSVDRTNDDFTNCNLVFAWISLAFSTLVFFGSLIMIVWIVTYSYSSKWSFSVYIAASGSLFLTNVLTNALIISRNHRLSTEERRISIRSSMLRRRVAAALENQLPETHEGFCHQEVQTSGVTKTPPPPYHDLPSGNAEANPQLTPIEAQINEPPVPEDLKQLLNKILHAINNSRTLENEQQTSGRTQESKCDHCKTRFPKPGTSTTSQQNNNAQPSSPESGIYPKLPDEVLDHIADPPMFIRALARYQSENRKREYEESIKKQLQEENRKKLQEGNRKKQLANQETLSRQNLGVAGNVVENLNQVPDKQTNTTTADNKSLMTPSQNAQGISPSKYLLQKLKSRTEQDHKYVHPTTSSQDPGSQHQIRHFNTVDKSRCPTRASQPDLSSQSARGFPMQVFINRQEVSQDLDSKSPSASRRFADIHRTGISLQDLRSKYSQDIDAVNIIGIPHKGYQLKKTTQVPDSFKSGNSTRSARLEDVIPYRHSEHEQAFDVADNSLQRMSPTDVLQAQQSTSSAIQQNSESISDSLPEEACLALCKTSADYQNLDPAEWFAAWNRGLNKISQSATSTLFGARL